MLMRCHCFLWLGGEHSLARPELPSRFTQQLSHLLFFFTFSLSLSLGDDDDEEDDADEPVFFYFFSFLLFLLCCLLCKTIDQLCSRMLKRPEAFGNTQCVQQRQGQAGRQYVDVSYSIHNSSNRDQLLKNHSSNLEPVEESKLISI